MKKITLITILLGLFLFFSCEENKTKNKSDNNDTIKVITTVHEVNLKADLTGLSNNQLQMIKYFIKASDLIDSMFFFENLENYSSVIASIKDSATLKKFKYNFGPWDRFNGNKPFIDGFGDKPQGGNFYPKDMNTMEFYEFDDSCKFNPYTLIRRNENNELYCLPYHVEFKNFIDTIVDLLNKAAELAEDPEFAEYLRQRAIAMQNDDYYQSDSIWINLRNNKLDFIIGPVYVLDDKLFNIKAEHQSFILLKDTVWTGKMEKYNKWLRFLQKAIPVPEEYRAEEPGTSSSIVVYDALYYGGSGKCGGTLISVVFPIDPKIQISQGVKNLQFKNVIKYKFDAVAKPISEIILTQQQKPYITGDAFFVNTILYEMANSLGIRNTINGKGTVRNSLKNYFTISDYIKNYSLSLFLADKLFEVGEIKNDLRENYFTFVVDLIRLIRFGEENDYAISNLVCFNYFVENKAIRYDKDGLITIDYEKMKEINSKLTQDIIIMQGNGDYSAMKQFIEKYNYIDDNLINLINKINQEKVPTDIYLIQGEKVLNLQ